MYKILAIFLPIDLWRFYSIDIDIPQFFVICFEFLKNSVKMNE